jgi:hypothetical protein
MKMTWLNYFKKWHKLLVRDSAWEVHFVNEPSLTTNAMVDMNSAGRGAILRVNPTSTPTERSICHEFAHILLSRLGTVSCHVTHLLPEEQRDFARQIYSDAEEETCEVLAEIFMRLEKGKS